MSITPHEAVAFEWYPPSWVQRLDDYERSQLMTLDEFLRDLDEMDEERDEPIDEAAEGWHSFCPPCMEYVVHTRPGGGWVPCGPGELPFPCSRCRKPLP